jgi:nucleoside-diphosphate-sugar epimerase
LIIVFGLGFTGKRLARKLLDRGLPVCAAVRDPGRFADLVQSGLKLNHEFPKNAAIFYSIPPLPADEDTRIESQIRALEPSRIVYISSTAVYGNQLEVNEDTAVNPNDERGRQRLNAENRMAAGPWTSLILRAAAIYGPGRGVHTALREGRLPRSAGSGIVSRIHVDDLAAHAEAGLYSDAKGAWPVADEAPCSSAEIAESLGIQPGGMEFKIAGRRVDGRKIREILGIKLKYPTWKTGIPASLSEE